MGLYTLPPSKNSQAASDIKFDGDLVSGVLSVLPCQFSRMASRNSGTIKVISFILKVMMVWGIIT